LYYLLKKIYHQTVLMTISLRALRTEYLTSNYICFAS